jgi:hypothetical protein
LIAKRRLVGGLYLLAGALTPLVLGAMGLGLGASEAYLRLAGLNDKPAIAAGAWRGLLAFPVILTVGLALRRRWAAPAEADADPPTSVDALGAAWALASSAAMVIMGIAVATTTLDRDLRTFRQLCSAFQANAWNATVNAGRTAAMTWPEGIYTTDTCQMVNRALFEQGRLGAQMFSYPQSPNDGLLPVPEMNEPYKTDTLVQLGVVDTAQRLAEASLARWGNRPFVVSLLAKIAIVKSDWHAAEGYLLVLAKDMAHGNEAKRLLGKIRSGNRFQDDQDIQKIRSYWRAGFQYDPRDVQGTLERLLDHNPENQMAFEYLMAHYLLTLQLETFATRAGDITQFGYEYLPAQFAEALVLHYSLTDQWQAIEDLPRDPATLERSQRFIALVRQHGGNRNSLAEAVLLEMPASYFGYFFRATRLVPLRP